MYPARTLALPLAVLALVALIAVVVVRSRPPDTTVSGAGGVVVSDERPPSSDPTDDAPDRTEESATVEAALAAERHEDRPRASTALVPVVVVPEEPQPDEAAPAEAGSEEPQPDGTVPDTTVPEVVPPETTVPDWEKEPPFCGSSVDCRPPGKPGHPPPTTYPLPDCLRVVGEHGPGFFSTVPDFCPDPIPHTTLCTVPLDEVGEPRVDMQQCLPVWIRTDGSTDRP